MRHSANFYLSQCSAFPLCKLFLWCFANIHLGWRAGQAGDQLPGALRGRRRRDGAGQSVQPGPRGLLLPQQAPAPALTQQAAAACCGCCGGSIFAAHRSHAGQHLPEPQYDVMAVLQLEALCYLKRLQA